MDLWRRVDKHLDRAFASLVDVPVRELMATSEAFERRKDGLRDFASIFRQVPHAREGGWNADLPRFHLRDYISRGDEEFAAQIEDAPGAVFGSTCAMRWPSGIRNSPAPFRNLHPATRMAHPDLHLGGKSCPSDRRRITIDAQGSRGCGSPQYPASRRDGGDRARGQPRSQLTAIRNPLNKVSAALSEVTQRERAWHVVTREANSICARFEPSKLVIRPALPRNRADYVRAVRIELDRERAIQAELAKLQPPSNYKGSYAQFLNNRQVALAALERLQKAVIEKNREDYVVAARELALRKSLVDHYAPAGGMPACAF